MSGILNSPLRLACVSASIADDGDERASTRLLPRHDELVHVSEPDGDEEDDDCEPDRNAWARERLVRMQH